MRQTTRLGMTPSQAKRAIHAMQQGDSFTYYIGDLLVDRANVRHGRRATAANLDKLAEFMLAAGVRDGFRFSPLSAYDKPIAGLGLGELTQRRIEPGMYEYLFTKN